MDVKKTTRFTYQLRAKVLKLAHQLTKKEGFNFSDAQRRAWEVVRLQEALRQGKEVVLRFTKTGDDLPQQRIATAVSTENYTPKGSNRRPNPLQIIYFDHTRQSVRSFNAARFVGYRIAA